MERVCIIGGSGTGKTTLANNLGRELNLPVYHIDSIHYLENWEIRNKNERDKIILEKINNTKWIMDGTYRSTLKQRLEKSDYIIYLDYPTLTQVMGIMKRFVQNFEKEKEEIPGCKEQMSWDFFSFTVNWRKNKRKEILEEISKVNQEKVHIFSNRKQLNKWYRNTFNKKMEIR